MGQYLKQWTRVTAGPRGRWVTLIAWILVVLGLSMVFPAVNQKEDQSQSLLPTSAMSVQATQLEQKYFPSGSGTPLIIAWENNGGLSSKDYQAIHQLYAGLENNPLPAQSFVPPLGNIPASALRASASKDGKALTTPLFFKQGTPVSQLQSSLDTLQHRATTQLGTSVFQQDLNASGLHARLTGPVGVETDANNLFKHADFTLLLATVLLVLLLLIILYRSPILAIIPLAGVGFAYGAISPLLGFMASHGWISVDAQAVSIMTVLLFGAGTDYCLFLISRYRTQLRKHPDPFEALYEATGKAGGAILMSALTVVLALLTLLAAHYVSYLRFAVPFSLAIAIMGITALTLLPALLAIFGRIAFWPFIPVPDPAIQEPQDNTKPGGIGAAVGWWVTQKPWTVIVASVVLLGALALNVIPAQYSYGLLDSFPASMPSRQGFAIISRHYPAGDLAPVSVLVKGNASEHRVQQSLQSLPFVDNVSSPQQAKDNPNLTRYQVTLSIDPYSTAAVNTIPRIQQRVKQTLQADGNAAGQVWTGGETATLYDTQQVTSRDQSVIIPMIIVLIGILLLLYLRSITATLYLLATVLLSFFSALGAGWLVIHYIYGSSAMQGLIPLYAFVFLVALGEDYNIFMVSSIWDNKEHMALSEAISGGVESTWGVITSAGLILAGTFAVLAVLPLQVLVQFGTVTATGVLLDTFVVRPLLVPSITRVLGKYAFWPGR